jgi:dihydrofolate synthase / folylpolyglutamate synthase
MEYKEVLDYLEKSSKFGIKLGLTNIKALLGGLGNPQNAYKTIHVAGTNGKGSVTAMCSSILEKANYKVGRYVSPHLTEFTERISINGKEISKEDVVTNFLKIKEKADSLKEQGIYITYFEFITALAFLYFKEQKVEIAVIETGLGGRLDATNVIEPEVSVITNIGLDHTNVLGDNKESIAREKAGIIKGTHLVTAESDKEILSLFQEICYNKKVNLVNVLQHQIVLKNDNLDGQTFSVKTNNEYYLIYLQLLGNHQIKNALTSICVMEILQKKGLNISKKAIIEGLKETKWPGRLELIQRKPNVLLDCAHNPNGMKQLVHFLKTIKYEKLIVVLGISEGKDYQKMIQIISPITDLFILTQAKYRGLNPNLLHKSFDEQNELKKKIIIVSNVLEATKNALKHSDDNDLVLLTGSIFMVGEARTIWHPQDLMFLR